MSRTACKLALEIIRAESLGEAVTPSICAHDANKPYNLLFRNTYENVRVREIVAQNWQTGVRFLNIWGAKFDKDRVDYHLGHLYVLQKLRDIVQEPETRSHLYIGINPSREFLNREREHRQAAYIRCTEHLLARTVLPWKGNRVSIHNCGDPDLLAVDAHQYNDTCALYRKIIDNLNCVFTPDTQRLFVSNPTEIDRTELERRLQDVFKVDDSASHALYDEFCAFFREGKHLLLNETEILLRIQNLAFTHLIARPHVIVVSTRHEHHWRCYRALCQIAGLIPVPELLLLDFVRLPNESDTMRSGIINSTIFVGDKTTEIQDKLKEATASYDIFLPQCFNYVIFPNRPVIEWSLGPMREPIKIEGPWNIDRYRAQGVAVHLLDLCKRELPQILAEYRAVIADAKRNYNSADLEWITFNHVAMLENLHEWLGSPLDINFRNSLEHFSRNPELLAGDYWKTIGLVGARVEKTLPTFDVSTGSLPQVVRIMRQLRNMDFYIWLTDKRYRDHYTHMVNVGCCGHTLLTMHPLDGPPMVEDIARRLGYPEGNKSVQAVLSLWWLVALLHDHAYAVSHYLRQLAPRVLVIRSQLAAGSSPRELEDWQTLSD